jgi:hypothetical protein
MLVDGLPCLGHPGQEDSSADVCACELFRALNQLPISKDTPSESLNCIERLKQNPCHQLHQLFLFGSPNDPISKHIPGPNVL